MIDKVPAYEGKGQYLFVSYAHKNSNVVYPIIKKMFDEKYRVWYDEGIAPGSEWPHNIEIHLKGCSLALIVVSSDSLASKNCDNEVVNALNNNKQIIQYSLDGSIHPLLKDVPVISNEEELFNLLSKELIGDDTGYDLALNNKRRLSLWNLLLGLSFILIVVLGLGIYGINNGYFDEYLPGRSISTQDITVKEEKNGIEVNNNVIAQAILEQLSNEDLFVDIEFKDDVDRFFIYKGLGYEEDRPMQYFDLTQFNDDEIYLDGCSEECLKLLKYLPSLRILHLDSDRIKSLKNLDDCPKLIEVYLRSENFPVEFSENRIYKVLVQR